ncbi:uncharacterized protein BO95DRAFT_100991 [Aspergillus brunneoviolaceus CBS 621.78]|uniref:Uncharacterized protein n=1 Tax=Aspergillus brunneoviolaceus CBS 621.78 TaxID=1450534 RepID=A0ACD1GBU0_9EURO|nr:hypothetical protein BO95DRAFT_100991 [Aspergillus brunneoviolaceus CBS 621.78]RAH46716.1 hypothetical protein BO95DRAFT_100991 [Aspergillus brunneoviolaceus CBS 621.78]
MESMETWKPQLMLTGTLRWGHPTWALQRSAVRSSKYCAISRAGMPIDGGFGPFWMPPYGFVTVSFSSILPIMLLTRGRTEGEEQWMKLCSESFRECRAQEQSTDAHPTRPPMLSPIGPSGRCGPGERI